MRNPVYGIQPTTVKDDIPSEYRSMILPNKIKAFGGWSRMDYIIPID